MCNCINEAKKMIRGIEPYNCELSEFQQGCIVALSKLVEIIERKHDNYHSETYSEADIRIIISKANDKARKNKLIDNNLK